MMKAMKILLLLLALTMAAPAPADDAQAARSVLITAIENQKWQLRELLQADGTLLTFHPHPYYVELNQHETLSLATTIAWDLILKMRKDDNAYLPTSAEVQATIVEVMQRLRRQDELARDAIRERLEDFDKDLAELRAEQAAEPAPAPDAVTGEPIKIDFISASCRGPHQQRAKNGKSVKTWAVAFKFEVTNTSGKHINWGQIPYRALDNLGEVEEKRASFMNTSLSKGAIKPISFRSKAPASNGRLGWVEGEFTGTIEGERFSVALPRQTHVCSQ